MMTPPDRRIVVQQVVIVRDYPVNGITCSDMFGQHERRQTEIDDILVQDATGIKRIA